MVITPIDIVGNLNDGEPVQNVPRSIREEGHEVLELRENGDGTYELLKKRSESDNEFL